MRLNSGSGSDFSFWNGADLAWRRWCACPCRDSKVPTRIHGPQPRGPGEGAVPRQAGGAGPGLAGTQGETRDLHPIARDEIYEVAAEALRNAHRHAHASRVEVEIRYDQQQFRLRVRDDGRGIDPAVLAGQAIEGHYGLRGMPERAAVIGGKLAIWSEVGAGTEVELPLPARTVYATSARRSWLSRLFASKRSA